MEIKTEGFVTKPAEGQHRKTWGAKALVTRLGKVNIVHLDSPSEEVIAERIKEVLREELRGGPFEDDCPLCREMSKYPHDAVYWDNPCRKCRKGSCEECDIDGTTI
ncbi:MAG: hypothetical protein ACOY3K_03175 [Candidatus Omnitrophota bacterium]